MKKTAYKKELVIRNTQQRNGSSNSRKEVRKIQSWLTLFSIQHPSSGTATSIDGDFGPATERAVKNFQRIKGVSENGVVDQGLFSELSANLKDAFERPLQSTDVRSLIAEVAENHLQNHPFELVINRQSNSGPWVRSYMDGGDGEDFFWCMGFAQTILDQAVSHVGKRFTSLMPSTFSCDSVGNAGIARGLLSKNKKIRRNSDLVKPGDLFLIESSPLDWTHTGIITSIQGDVIETIEGNTNFQGSRNGVTVRKRMRNYMRSRIDVFSIEPLT
ncbi:peptidoglycan-binding protein [Aquimarina sp. AU58]|uniref:peptidoglycan-binding domain-containing protein n=1 Tax=Aquimarina sp. AU58 TaxID=1874112 RepID=UPI000D6E9182|nr:peptidoglycan-binding domain-containing protein [Aquimarina sp. AU58]